MIRQPWKIWTVFSLCLTAAVVAMTWLTTQTVDLDTQRERERAETELARRKAELQERINAALYRMDLALFPIVVQEASRPAADYRTSVQVPFPASIVPAPPKIKTLQSINRAEAARALPRPSSQTARRQASNPTASNPPKTFEIPSQLRQRPEFVLLNFEIDPSNVVQTPAVDSLDGSAPTADSKTNRLKINASQSVQACLAQANRMFSFEQLLAVCPPLISEGRQSLPFDNNILTNPVIDNIATGKITASSQPNAAANNARSAANEAALGFNRYQQQERRNIQRGNAEFDRRRLNTQKLALNQEQMFLINGGFANNQYAGTLQNAGKRDDPFIASAARQSPMQPTWVSDQLVLIRQIEDQSGSQPKITIQGCWLNWPAIQDLLRQEVSDLLPAVDFHPIKNANTLNASRALTTVPVQLSIDTPQLLADLALESDLPGQTSGLIVSLWVAWFGLGVTALATAILLQGVMRLSDRRATFVSAVTHELRTPLTTFRMYSEMLAEKMVPADKQHEYAQTLKVQSDRLAHLVENVLQFARLEKNASPTPRETLKVHDLLSRFEARLFERCRDAELELSVHTSDVVAKTTVTTQPGTIEQIVFNLVDNACKYGVPASQNRIEIDIQPASSTLQFAVQDFGPGVDPAYKRRLFQAFSKSDLEAANTAPGVGLGLALCQRMAASIGGDVTYQPNELGARFVLSIPAECG